MKKLICNQIKTPANISVNSVQEKLILKLPKPEYSLPKNNIIKTSNLASNVCKSY